MARREPDSPLLSQENPNLQPRSHSKSLAPPTSHPDRASLPDRAAVYANDHLQALRMVPWVLASIGAFLVARYSGMVSGTRTVG